MKLNLVQGSDGRLYGETFNGQGNSFGTVFAVNTNGTGFTNLYSFNSSGGEFPKGGLILSGTNLFGTTYEGGNGTGDGTVFAVSPDGTVFTNLYNFSGNDGSSPQADLVLSSNILYGSTYGGALMVMAPFSPSIRTARVLPISTISAAVTARTRMAASFCPATRFRARLITEGRTSMVPYSPSTRTARASPIF